MKLALRQTQRVVMTPLLQQAIQLLQLSTLELEQVVRKELEENPLLEEVVPDDAETPPATAGAEAPSAESGPTAPEEPPREAATVEDARAEELARDPRAREIYLGQGFIL